jgi:pimeloyl-ACP methyl ester carboxylesterase
MSVAYALKHPDRVHKLVLVSPVGVPESPYWDHQHTHDAPEPVEAMAEGELAQDQASVTKGGAAATGRLKTVGTSGAVPSEVERPKMQRTWWSVLWEQNVRLDLAPPSSSNS